MIFYLEKKTNNFKQEVFNWIPLKEARKENKTHIGRWDTGQHEEKKYDRGKMPGS